jgi:methylenetetrahydrofolate reductase (NADPH)
MAHIQGLAHVSIEVTARGNPVAELVEHCEPGTEAFLTWLPGDDPARQVAIAAGIARAGFHPVPHLAVRMLENERVIDDFLAHAAGEAGVSRVLVIAGDRAEPAGPFASSLDLLETGILQKHGIGLVYVAGHPEGHPRVARDVMDAALRQKLAWGAKNGIAMRVVTQFCFEPEPVIEWLARFQGEFDVPVRIGIAGPASPATLLKFAVRCGVGNSVRALQRQMGRFTRLLAESSPDEVVDGLLGAAVQKRLQAEPGFHLFPFGGLRTAQRWLQSKKQSLAGAPDLRQRAGS